MWECIFTMRIQDSKLNRPHQNWCRQMLELAEFIRCSLNTANLLKPSLCHSDAASVCINICWRRLVFSAADTKCAERVQQRLQGIKVRRPDCRLVERPGAYLLLFESFKRQGKNYLKATKNSKNGTKIGGSLWSTEPEGTRNRNASGRGRLLMYLRCPVSCIAE